MSKSFTIKGKAKMQNMSVRLPLPEKTGGFHRPAKGGGYDRKAEKRNLGRQSRDD